MYITKNKLFLKILENAGFSKSELKKLSKLYYFTHWDEKIKEVFRIQYRYATILEKNPYFDTTTESLGLKTELQKAINQAAAQRSGA